MGPRPLAQLIVLDRIEAVVDSQPAGECAADQLPVKRLIGVNHVSSVILNYRNDEE